MIYCRKKKGNKTANTTLTLLSLSTYICIYVCIYNVDDESVVLLYSGGANSREKKTKINNKTKKKR